MFCSYQEMYMGIKDEKLLIAKRLEMVRYASDNGYKVAARFYKCSKNTIKKWCRRYSLKGINGLRDLSRKPKNSPKTIKQEDIDLITSTTKEAKLKNKYITVNNIRRKTKISNHSDTTINRYINKSLGKIKNKKHIQEYAGDIKWKQHLLPFQLVQVDIKYLTDIENLKPYFYDRNLMKYQITARDVATGFPIVAYAPEKAVCYTKKFLEDILYPFLSQFKDLDLKSITIQTDNGAEFTNKYRKTRGQSPRESAFSLFIICKFKKHRTIIPGHCTAESDVESFHWSIERDCLAWDDIVDNNTLIQYTTDYIDRYLTTTIETRGYSPLEKIKTALDVTDITFPKPQLLTV